MKRQRGNIIWGRKESRANMFLLPTKQALPWVPQTFHARFQVSVTSFEYRLNFQSIFLQS